MNDTTIAKTILEQLGGPGRLTAMIGARDFLAGERSLQFSFAGKAAQGIWKVRVELDERDTYTVRFYAGRKLSIREVEAREGVYDDVLKRTFEQVTGLYLSL